MSRRYTISELVELLGVSRTAVNRKIKKYGFDIVQDYVDFKKVNLVAVSEEQMKALIDEIEITRNKLGQTHDSGVSQSVSGGVSLDDKVKEKPIGEGFIYDNKESSNIDTLINRVVSLSEVVQQQSESSIKYIERMAHAEQKALLLEDIEKRKENEYLKVVAENKQLKAENDLLKAELERYKTPWWKLRK